MAGDLDAFGQVLPDEAVGVLVRAPFPGRVGVGEVHGQVRGHSELGVAGHLGALVPGQRTAHQRWQVVDPIDEHIRQASGLFTLGQAQHDQEPAGALHQGRDSCFAGLTDYQVTFPRSWDAAVGGDLWPVIDADHPDDPPAGTLTQRPAAFTHGALGLQDDPFACKLAFGHRVDPPVDRFVGHDPALGVGGFDHRFNAGVRGLQKQTPSDLPRCPGPEKIRPYPGSEDRIGVDLAHLRTLPTILGLTVRGHRLIAAGRRRIPSTFPPHHRVIPADLHPDLTVRLAGPNPHRNVRPISKRQQPPRHQQLPLPNNACCYEAMTPSTFEVANDQSPDMPPSWNVAPMQDIRFITERPDADGVLERRLEAARWGLVPAWSKDSKAGARLINARSETITEKPSFRTAAAKRRALILMNGYYEWQKNQDGTKTPTYLHPEDEAELLVVAGLYEFWPNPELPEDHPEKWLVTATVITTSATDALGHIRERSPLIIPKDLQADWLDSATTDKNQVRELVDAMPEPHLVPRVVGKEVGSVRNNGPQLIEPVK